MLEETENIEKLLLSVRDISNVTDIDTKINCVYSRGTFAHSRNKWDSLGSCSFVDVLDN